MEQGKATPTSPWKGRLVLLGIVLFFVTPLMIVFAMQWMHYQPSGKSHGVMIQPARKLLVNAHWALPNQTHQPNTLWNERWNIVVVAEQCDAACASQLHLVRQVHVSLAKEIDRVQRVLITTHSDVGLLNKTYPDLIILNQPTEAIKETLAQFGLRAGQTQAGVYLVDPLGHLVMYYPANVEGKALRSDILKLLKFSWAG